jgi:hypothetical protein
LGVPLKVPVEDMVVQWGVMLFPDSGLRESSYYMLSLPSSLFTAPGLGYAKDQGPILVSLSSAAAWFLPEVRMRERRSLLLHRLGAPLLEIQL